MENSDRVRRPVNRKNPAMDAYVDVMRDVIALRYFARNHKMTMDRWDQLVSRDTQIRLLSQFYVRIRKPDVLLTEDGLEVMGYREYKG